MAKDDINNEENHNGHGGLPSEIIIYDILTRVPTESLIRFRCVCKQWHDLLKDPLFVDLHLRRSNNNSLGFVSRYGGPTSRRLIIYNPRTKQDDLDDEKRRSFMVFFDINRKKKLDIPLPPALIFPKEISNKNIRILDSFNGLLLMCCEHFVGRDKKVNYLVYNPMIPCCSMNVPHPEIFRWRPHYRYRFDQYRFCLAYDSLLAKYKVVCYGMKYDTKKEKHKYFCRIVTLGVDKDSWRELVVPNPQHTVYIPFFEHSPRPVFANCSLHWAWGSKVSAETEEILSLNVCKETFYTIRVPPECYTGKRHTLLKMGGMLSIVDHVSATQLKLWVSKKEDLEDKHVWKEECSIDMSQFDTDDFLGGYIPFAVHTHPKREFIFRKCTNDYEYHCYYSYDMELKKLDLVYEKIVYDPLLWHVNSLTLP